MRNLTSLIGIIISIILKTTLIILNSTQAVEVNQAWYTIGTWINKQIIGSSAVGV